MSKPTWIPRRPADADRLDELIERVASGGAAKAPGAVRLRAASSAWFVEAARAGATDLRQQVTEALRNAGTAVVGLEAVAEALSPSREVAIRGAVTTASESSPGSAEALFDVQVVADLLGEIDRLRAKLHQAALARDLTGRAASNLRDACEDITPRAAKFRKPSKDPKE
jgi:hypothetical protein